MVVVGRSAPAGPTSFNFDLIEPDVSHNKWNIISVYSYSKLSHGWHEIGERPVWSPYDFCSSHHTDAGMESHSKTTSREYSHWSDF